MYSLQNTEDKHEKLLLGLKFSKNKSHQGEKKLKLVYNKNRHAAYYTGHAQKSAL